jgi:hypothetical protein
VAKAELEANIKYQELKEKYKAGGEGFREVKKAQTAVVSYCLIRLDEMGKI